MRQQIQEADLSMQSEKRRMLFDVGREEEAKLCANSKTKLIQDFFASQKRQAADSSGTSDRSCFAYTQDF